MDIAKIKKWLQEEGNTEVYYELEIDNKEEE